jgi:hypothetical protein
MIYITCAVVFVAFVMLALVAVGIKDEYRNWRFNFDRKRAEMARDAEDE